MVKKIEHLAADAIIDAMVDGVAVVDLNGIVIQANKACLKMFGFKSLDEAGGVIFTEFLSERDIPRALESFKKCLEIGVGMNVEFAVKDASGKEFPILLNGSVLKDKKGEFVGVVVVLRDITERKRAEEELARLSNAVKMSTDSIVISDLEGKIIDVNEATLKMYGTDDKRDLIGKNSFDLIAPEDREIAFAGMKEVLKKGYTKSREYRIIIKDGSKIPVEMSSGIMKGTDGKPIGFVGITRDITERKRAEEALRESKERYRTLFESTADGILVADIQTRKFKFANPAICRMLGYSEEELKGMGVDDIHPKDVLEHVISEFKAQARGEKILAPNIPCLRKDGTIVYADIDTTKALIDGRECNIGFFRDITERKQAEEALRGSEERYRTLVETMNEGLDIVDENGVIVYVNDKLCEMSGYSRDEMIGRPITDFLDESAQDVYEEQRVMRRKGERGSYELVRTRKDGQKIFTLVSAAPIFDADGNFEGSFAVITDLAAILQATVSLLERMAP